MSTTANIIPVSQPVRISLTSLFTFTSHLTSLIGWHDRPTHAPIPIIPGLIGMVNEVLLWLWRHKPFNL